MREAPPWGSWAESRCKGAWAYEGKGRFWDDDPYERGKGGGWGAYDGPVVRGAAQNGMESTVSPFERRHLPTDIYRFTLWNDVKL